MMRRAMSMLLHFLDFTHHSVTFSFKHDGRSYSCAEQFIQSQKAEKYNDDAAKTKIMLACDQQEIKCIGNNIRGYVQ